MNDLVLHMSLDTLTTVTRRPRTAPEAHHEGMRTAHVLQLERLDATPPPPAARAVEAGHNPPQPLQSPNHTRQRGSTSLSGLPTIRLRQASS